MPDQRHGLPGRYRERNIFQDPIVVFVSEPDIFKFDAAFSATLLERHGRRRDQNRQIERLEDSM